MEKCIYFIIDTMGVGGAETQLLRIMPHLKTLGWNISLVTMKDKNEFRDELQKQGVHVSSLGYGTGFVAFSGNVKRLVNEINECSRTNPVVIHSHIVSSNLFSRFLTLFLKGKIILVNTVHNTNEGSSIRYLMYKLTRNRAHFVSAMSQAALEVHRKKGASRNDRLNLVYNGIDLDHFKKNVKVKNDLQKKFCVKDNFVWLAVGNLSPQKNFSNLLKAWKILLSKQETGARLFIVGEGVEKTRLQKQIMEDGLSNSVQLLGRRNDVQDLMNMADGYVMSSDWEGFPMVLLESAATQLPIVATDVGGNSEIVLDGTSGYICPPKDAVALSNAMRSLMDKPQQELVKMGSIGRKHVQEHFSVESIAGQWNGIYESLLR